MRFIVWAGILVILLSMGLAGGVTERLHPEGVLAPDEPAQGAVTETKPWKKNGYLIRPLATFKISARVLLTDHYSWDRESEIAPVDLTLGWGPLSDTRILSQLTLSHGHRHYRWSARNLPLPSEDINRHMANMHIVPSDDYLETKLRRLVPGDIVSIQGFLIEAAMPDGWSWKSSLTRNDSGHGACELIWAEKIQVLPTSNGPIGLH